MSFKEFIIQYLLHLLIFGVGIFIGIAIGINILIHSVEKVESIDTGALINYGEYGTHYYEFK